MQQILLKPEELDSLVEQAVKRTLESLGTIPKYISRTEMIHRVGRGTYDRGVISGRLKIIKNGGKTSSVRCLRSEFERYEKLVLV
jgi:hypothetical protein